MIEPGFKLQFIWCQSLDQFHSSITFLRASATYKEGTGGCVITEAETKHSLGAEKGMVGSKKASQVPE